MGRYYLCRRSKVVSKVNAHYPSILEVHHEVGQVAVPNAQHILAAGDGGDCADEVRAECEEGLRRGSQLHECSSVSEGIVVALIRELAVASACSQTFNPSQTSGDPMVRR